MRWIIQQDEAGLSARDWLAGRLPDAPAGYLGQLLRSGRVRGDGAPLSGEARVRCGMQVELPDSRRLQQLVATARPCRILAETGHWVVAFKPAGLPVHRSAGHQDNLTDRLQAHYARQQEPFHIAPVQRLDIGTSGPVLFGKGRQATGELGRLLMDRGLAKLYLALVAGRPPASGRLDRPLQVDGKLKAASGRYRTLRRVPGGSLLLVTIGTGRKHQIRRQLAAAGHPVAGDRRYGSRLEGPDGRLFLHQCRIRFRDPWLHQPVWISSPLPDELRGWLAELAE